MAKRGTGKRDSKQSTLQIDGVGLQGISSPINSVQTIVVPHTKNPEVGSAKLAKKAKTIIPDSSNSNGYDLKCLVRFSNGSLLIRDGFYYE